MSQKPSLKLFHFFPNKLNLYGDRGNIITLQKRCEWRGIDLEVVNVNHVEEVDLSEMDILFIGGGSDREQSLATAEFIKIKDELANFIENDGPGLTICGGYQFLGKEYIDANGNKLETLGILDFKTISASPRFIGNISLLSDEFGPIVGFENHGGRTYHNYEPFGKVTVGHGNNEDGFEEGIFYKNLIGTYLHGPLLPKNPSVADFLIEEAFKRKYGIAKAIETIVPLDDVLELTASTSMRERLAATKK